MTFELSARPVADIMLALGTPQLPHRLADLLRSIAPFTHAVAFADHGATKRQGGAVPDQGNRPRHRPHSPAQHLHQTWHLVAGRRSPA